MTSTLTNLRTIEMNPKNQIELRMKLLAKVRESQQVLSLLISQQPKPVNLRKRILSPSEASTSEKSLISVLKLINK